MAKIKKYLLSFGIGYFISATVTPLIYDEASFLSILLSFLPTLMALLVFFRKNTRKNTPLFIILFFLISYFFVFLTGDIVRFIYYDANTVLITICLFVNIICAFVFDKISQKNKSDVSENDYKPGNPFVWRSSGEASAALCFFTVPIITSCVLYYNHISEIIICIMLVILPLLIGPYYGKLIGGFRK